MTEATKATSTDTANGRVHHSIITITPQLAQEYLARNTHNRKINARHVDRLAGAIKRGEWKLNGDPIRFDKHGKLIDGQHRLLAVIEAGKGIQSFVVRNLDPAAQETIDSGKARGFQHVLQLRGVANANSNASTTRALFAYKAIKTFDSQQSGTATRPSPTNQELMKLFNRNRTEIEHSTRFINQARVDSGLKMPAGVAAFHVVITQRFGVDVADSFMSAVADPSYAAEKDDPIIQLRKRLIEMQSVAAASGRSSRAKMALFVKAFNYWMRGERVKQLRWRGGGPAAEAFPAIVQKEEVE